MEPRLLLAVFTVTTTADSGPGSLRQAILDANARVGDDRVAFNIAGAGVQTIAPKSPLPEVTGPTDIDGRTQPGYSGKPLVELDGSGAGASADGLVLRGTGGAGSWIRALAINRFGRHGVSVLAGTNTIERSYVGTNAPGTAAAGNGQAGVFVAATVSIGTSAAGAGNVISGNGFAGVWVKAYQVGGITLANNFIGTDATGSAAVGNAWDGVLVDDGSVDVGVKTASGLVGNVISGNGGSGVRTSSGAGTVRIFDNLIGTDAGGTRALGNGTSPLTPYRDGVTIMSTFGTATVGALNVISGNAGNGVFAGGDVRDVDVTANRIGTDRAGNAALANGGHGVSWSGVTAGNLSNNVISGNRGDGVHVDASGGEGARYTITGNRIGTNADATAALGNRGDGIEVIGRSNMTIGGPTAPARNVVSANGGAGISVVQGGYSVDLVFANALTVQGNYVGTDGAGGAALGNRLDGIFVSGKVARDVKVVGNLVSGNEGNGVTLVGNLTDAQDPRFAHVAFGGNYVGTNAVGATAIPNAGNGLEIQSVEGGVDVGGSANPATTPATIDPAAVGRNVISGNAGHGVYITGKIRLPGSRLVANFIGTDAAGAAPLGNGGSGVYIDSGLQHKITGGNVISANGRDGVTILSSPSVGAGYAEQITISGNRIGTNAAGSDTVSNLGNRGNGVAMYNSGHNLVGGVAEGDSTAPGNTIAFNAGAGVFVAGKASSGAPTWDRITRNSIFANGGLGIDLSTGPAGVTPNDPGDADEGPNDLLNFPIIRQAYSTATETVVFYSIDHEDRISVYASPEADPSGYGEGKLFLGSFGRVRGDGVQVLAPAPEGWYITATSDALETSEFSPAVRVVSGLPPATVVGRRVFYNNSSYDGRDPAASAADDAAIDPSKIAVVPGARSSFDNVTDYSKGINGVMIDMVGLAPGAVLTPADFAFRTGTSSDPASFGAGPAPSSVTVRRGAGVGGSDRVTLIWPDYVPHTASPAQAVANGWLEVTVKPTDRTRLAAPDVFYFGNLVGETLDGTKPAVLQVTAFDVLRTRWYFGMPAGVSISYDHNRDGTYNMADVAIARANLLRRLPMLNAAAAPQAAPAAGRTPYAARRRSDVLGVEAAPVL